MLRKGASRAFHRRESRRAAIQNAPVLQSGQDKPTWLHDSFAPFHLSFRALVVQCHEFSPVLICESIMPRVPRACIERSVPSH